MSLLMEALRKAEEAKRRAAQGTEPDKPAPPQVAADAIAPSPPSSDDLIAQLVAEPVVREPEPRSDTPNTNLFEEAVSAPIADTRSTSGALDIPLGFTLDPDVEDTAKDLQPDHETAIPKISAPNTQLPFGEDIFASLKLTDAPEVDIQKDMPDFLLELAVHSTQHHPADDLTLAMKDLAEDVDVPEPYLEPVVQPIVQAAIAPAPAPAPVIAPDPETDPAPAIAKEKKFREAIAAKKSVRALFASKSKSAAAPQRRLLILGSIAAGVIVAVIGSWLALSGLTGSGNQYVIPPLADNVPYQDPGLALVSEPVIAPMDEPGAEPNADLTVASNVAVAPSESTAAVNPAGTNSVQPVTVTDSQVAAAPADTDTIAATATAITPIREESGILPSPPLSEPAQAADNTATAPANIPVTPAPSVAVISPMADPETGIYELPLDAGLTGSASASAGSPSPIRISRSEPMRNPDMQMLSAWSAYQQGDFAAARILYQQSLARDPDNRDALLGVAASAMQQGDMVNARRTYERLLSLNPRDPLARTGLLETTTSTDPVRRETDLKALQTDHPEIAAVSYSLGNLYASQQRWHDAQQAYYNALLTARTQAEGPVSPDYAFNLAISLERINQPDAALNFYREALTLSAQHTPGFDMTILDQRLRALERSRP